MPEILSRLRSASLYPAAMAIAGLAAAAATTNHGALVAAAVVAIVAAASVPPRALVFAWGVLLPIYGLGTIPTTAFDLARLLGAGLILCRIPRELPVQKLIGWWLPLTILGLFLITVSVVSPIESPAAGVAMIISAGVALVVATRPSIFRLTLAGFATGATISAFVLLLQAAAISNPAPYNASTGRLAGLSNNAPRASIEFAIASVVLFVWLRRSHGWARLAQLAGLLCCAAALACSGGRTGLAGLGLACLAGVRHGVIRLRNLLLIGAAVCATFALSAQYGVELLTFDRLTNPSLASAGIGPPDITTGRLTVLGQSWRGFVESPILGLGERGYNSRYGEMPHFAPLAFATSAGILGAVIGFYLFFRLCRFSLTKPDSQAGVDLVVAVCLACVLMVSACLEPNGPFIGAGPVTVLFIVAVLVARARSERAPLTTSSGDIRQDIHHFAHIHRGV